MARLMTYNIKWFTDAFEPDNSLGSSPDATKQIDAVAAVIAAVDPDLIGITEAPNTTTTTGNTPAQVWNPYQNAAAKPLKADLFEASVHFPVTVDIA